MTAKDLGFSPESLAWWAAHEGESGLLCDVLRDVSVDRNSGVCDPNGRGSTPFYAAGTYSRSP